MNIIYLRITGRRSGRTRIGTGNRRLCRDNTPQAKARVRARLEAGWPPRHASRAHIRDQDGRYRSIPPWVKGRGAHQRDPSG